MSAEVKSVLLLGPPGSGKSSLGNLLLQASKFDVSSDAASSQTAASKTERNAAGTLEVTDTPGISSTDQDDAALTRRQIVQAAKGMRRGVDVVFLVISMGRYASHHHVAFRFLFDAVLGPEAYNNCVLVITNCSRHFVNPATAQKKQTAWLQEALETKRNEAFADLYDKVGRRIVFVSNEVGGDVPQALAEQARQHSLAALQKSLSSFHPKRVHLQLEKLEEKKVDSNLEWELPMLQSLATEEASEEERQTEQRLLSMMTQRMGLMMQHLRRQQAALLADLQQRSEAEARFQSQVAQDLLTFQQQQAHIQRKASKHWLNQAAEVFDFGLKILGATVCQLELSHKF